VNEVCNLALPAAGKTARRQTGRAMEET